MIGGTTQQAGPNMEIKERKSEKLGVLTIGFSPVVSEGLQTILTKDEKIKVVGNAPDEHEALQHIKHANEQGQPVRVVLTDTRNGKLDGAQATKLIKEEFPDVVVLVLTENLNNSDVIDAIHAGASGYFFLKDMLPEVLRLSIHRAVEGAVQIKTELLHTAIEHLIQNGRKTLAERTAESANLTEREIDVLRLMGNGDSNKVIAATLGITLDTTKKHIRNIIDKLQAQSRTHAAIIAAQAGIIGNPVTPFMENRPEPWLIDQGPQRDGSQSREAVRNN
jgi:DNA-binding NarL/FixJ family response regulator